MTPSWWPRLGTVWAVTGLVSAFTAGAFLDTAWDRYPMLVVFLFSAFMAGYATIRARFSYRAELMRELRIRETTEALREVESVIRARHHGRIPS